ncbi:MAG: 50S ribosomal protein L25 [Actinomycetota bacterium]|nr:50S ribosomal protein L25 [Actinomycetota bacterium]MDQ3680086.1 50S ribosomal protein L25 [Actinomycetota bacterium]
MPEIKLAAEVGRATGSRSSGRLRAAGRIPGVIYGHGAEPTPVAVEGRALRSALTTDAGLNALLDLQVDGASHLTVARDIQRDPVRGTVIHVDFQIVRRDEVIAADVPVNLVGEAEELHRADGVVDHQLFTLTVNATPGRIPNDIEIDISGLAVGDTIRVGDIGLPEGVTTEVDPEAPVVVGQPPQVSEEDLVTEADAEAAATLEAEEAEPDAQAGAATVADAAQEGEAGTEG